MPAPATQPPGAVGSVIRAIARGRQWRFSEYICRSGPGDRPLEEQHQHVTIAAVLEGTFSYRAGAMSALLHPGALLLGNHSRCFECHHHHGRGDRCVVLHLAPEFFAEVAASVAGTGTFEFPTAMLPAARNILPWLAHFEVCARSADQLDRDETVARAVEAIIATTAGTTAWTLQSSARDERRIGDVVHHIDCAFRDGLELDDLAGIAGMSKYHFLRSFRKTVGSTPYQYLLGVRLRRAAVRLATSREAISVIAFDTGFGDLSTFNRRFRTVFGISPRRYRGRNCTA